jgi:putative ABC transport system permease protein
MAPRWSKVIRDLFANRTRTLLVVLSIAVGVAAFGAILAGLTTMRSELQTSYLAINPASAVLTTSAFDDDLVAAARRVPGVAEAQGQRAVAARAQIGPATWIDMQLFVLPDDGVTTINSVRPERGAWPPPDRAILIERASLPKTGVTVGAPLRVELPGRTARTLTLAGLTHDLSLPPAPIAGQAFGYINAATLAWLGGPTDHNQLLITTATGRADAAHIQAVAAQVERLIERSGREVQVIDVPTPLQHPAELVLGTIVVVLSTLGILALLISGFLIINTISAILNQQIRQIGIMKAIGARTRQIMGLYVVLVAAFGLLALLIAVPLGMAGAYGLTLFVASQLNVTLEGFRPPLSIIALQCVAAILIPIVAAALPIRAAARITVREALSGDTTTPPAHAGLFVRLLSRIPMLTRPTVLALRNTFRRRGRLVRTLIALSLGGAVFVSVFTLRASLFTTLDDSIAAQQYDLEVQFSRPYRAERAAQDARSVAEVRHVESLRRAQAFPVRPDGSTAEVVNLRALPAETSLLAPRMAAGRWLDPADERGLVLSTNYLTKDPAVQLGDSITLQIADKEATWRIVGFVEEFLPPTTPAVGYVNLPAFMRVMGEFGRTDTLRIATAGHDAAAHAAAAQALERRLSERGYEVRLIRSRTEDRAILTERFDVLTGVLSIMAGIIGVVGGLGLAGTMSINVLERTREIGIMRAVGAADGAVQQVVFGEGLTIGLLAWLIGTLVSFPLSFAMSYQMGMALLNLPLTWTYASGAVGAWLGIVLLIAAAASYLPARNATRLTVREVLAYE